MDAKNAARKHPLERQNMLAGIVNGAFFNMAQAFAEPYALLPVFLSGFFSSKLLIGLIVGLMQATMVLPQLPISRILRRHPHLKKPFMLAGIWTRCGVWGMLVTLAVFSSETSSLLLWHPS